MQQGNEFNEQDILRELGLIEEEKGEQMQTEEQGAKQPEEKQEVKQPEKQEEEEFKTKEQPIKTAEQQQQEMDIGREIEAAFKQITGQKFDPKNIQHVVLANQIAQQIQAQKAVMDWLARAVDKEFDAWLNEKVKTMPYSDVQVFQNAVATGNLAVVQQWIEARKKEYLAEKEGKQDNKNLPQQATEKQFTQQEQQYTAGQYGDILSPEELEAIKELL